jgi:hypothetical protein
LSFLGKDQHGRRYRTLPIQLHRASWSSVSNGNPLLQENEMAEKKINGRLFRVEPVLAIQALELQGRLLKVLGPALGRLPEVIKLASDKGADQTQANLAAVQIMMDVFSNVSSQEYSTLIKDIVELAQLQGPSGQFNQVDIDGVFTGDLGSIYPVVVFVLQEQFSDFFSGLLGSGSRAKKLAS